MKRFLPRRLSAPLAWLIARTQRARGAPKIVGILVLGALLWVGWREVGSVTLTVRPSVGIVPLVVRVEGSARGRGMVRVEGWLEGWDVPLLVAERDLDDDPEKSIRFSEVWLLDAPGEWTLRACVVPKGPCRESRVIVRGDDDDLRASWREVLQRIPTESQPS